MKKLISLLALSFWAINALMAQDVIVKKDGTTVISKVLKVTDQTVEYKNWSNLEGPTYTVSLDKIATINYQNGSIDRFELKEETETTGQAIPTPKLYTTPNNQYSITPPRKLYREGNGLYDIDTHHELSYEELRAILPPKGLGEYSQGAELMSPNNRTWFIIDSWVGVGTAIASVVSFIGIIKTPDPKTAQYNYVAFLGFGITSAGFIIGASKRKKAISQGETYLDSVVKKYNNGTYRVNDHAFAPTLSISPTHNGLGFVVSF